MATAVVIVVPIVVAVVLISRWGVKVDLTPLVVVESPVVVSSSVLVATPVVITASVVVTPVVVADVFIIR